MDTSLKSLIEEKDMAIIVSLPENRVDLAEAAIEAGADAIKLHINVDHRASGNTFHGLEEYKDTFHAIRQLYTGPLGIVLGDNVNEVNQVDTSKLKNIGFTYFSLYSKDITSDLLLQNNLEKTVAVDHLFKPEIGKVIENFDIQAVELSVVEKEDYGKPLNFNDLILYKKYRLVTDLPLIIPSQKKLVPNDMRPLMEVGVNAVMLGAVTIGTTAESIRKTVSDFRKVV